jgi:hypothetical protein
VTAVTLRDDSGNGTAAPLFTLRFTNQAAGQIMRDGYEPGDRRIRRADIAAVWAIAAALLLAAAVWSSL